MKIAVYQAAGVAGDKEKALTTLARQARKAASRGARVLVFPELFLTGYATGGAVAALAEPAGGPSAARAAAIARREGIAILYGFPERAGGRCYDAALLVDAGGRLRSCHRKLHLYGAEEKRLFTPGDTWTLFELEGWRIGVLICFDVEFPEAVRELALAGAELVLVPAALPRHAAIVARSLVPVRALENQIFLAYADLCGEEGAVAFCGRSAILGPEGDVLARAGGRGPVLLTADLDRRRLAASRRAFSYLAERRAELYSRGGRRR
ncbi:MAG: carbon-nitrogen hydrolase family protein [Desulfobacterales bacterium]